MKFDLKLLVATAICYAPALVAAHSTRRPEYDSPSARKFAHQLLRREINDLVEKLSVRAANYHAARELNDDYQRADELYGRGLINMLSDAQDSRGNYIEARGEKTDELRRQAKKLENIPGVTLAKEAVKGTVHLAQDGYHSGREKVHNVKERVTARLHRHSESGPSTQDHGVEPTPQGSSSTNVQQPSNQPGAPSRGLPPPLPPHTAQEELPAPIRSVVGQTLAPPHFVPTRERSPSPVYAYGQFQKPNEYVETHKPDERD